MRMRDREIGERDSGGGEGRQRQRHTEREMVQCVSKVLLMQTW